MNKIVTYDWIKLKRTLVATEVSQLDKQDNKLVTFRCSIIAVKPYVIKSVVGNNLSIVRFFKYYDVTLPHPIVITGGVLTEDHMVLKTLFDRLKYEIETVPELSNFFETDDIPSLTDEFSINSFFIRDLSAEDLKLMDINFKEKSFKELNRNQLAIYDMLKELERDFKPSIRASNYSVLLDLIIDITSPISVKANTIDSV